jgi:tRNA dimethylallyltransferase
VVRALEIHALTGEPASRQRRAEAPDFRIARVGLILPRPVLYSRIDDRIDGMLAAGWVDEVRRLQARGLTAESPAMSAIGYAILAGHLEGRFDLDEAVRRIRRATRLFVRRQANWFKRDDPGIAWFESSPRAAAQIEAHIRTWLGAGGTPADAGRGDGEDPRDRG